MLGTVAVLAASCGGDGALSEDDYVTRLEELSQALSDGQAGLDDRYETDLGTAEDPDQRLELAKQKVADGVALRRKFVEGLAALDPPAGAKAAHEGVVEAGRAYVARFEEALADLQQVESVDEIQPIIAGTALSDARGQLTLACDELARAAGAEMQC